MKNRLAQLKSDAKAAKWSKWIKSEADERAMLEGCTFKPKLGEHVVRFFKNCLRLGEGQWAGQPFVLLPWQRDDVIMPLFSWVRADGTRRFRVAYVSCGKKNGKSPLGAGIGLYMLVGDGEPGAKIASAATEIEQARIVHNEAIRMVMASPELKAALKINRTTSNISFPETNSWYRAWSGEHTHKAKEGYNLHTAIADELHVWGHPMMDVMRYSFLSRRQPLFFMITTAGVWDETSVGWQEYTKAKRVLSGETVDQQQFVYIAEPDKGDDWKLESTWRKANPSLGAIVELETVARACQLAQDTPRLENEFRHYLLNQWTEQSERWLPMDAWNECSAAAEIPEGATVSAGADLASVQDLTAFVIVYRDEADVYHIQSYFWLPESCLAETKNNPNQKLYQTWHKQGFLEVTPGTRVDYNYVRRRIVELSEQYNISAIAFDTHNAEQLMHDVQEEHGVEVYGVQQGFRKMNEPSKQLEAIVVARNMRHGGNPILSWCAQNAACKASTFGDYIMPCKPQKSSPLKIDGITALVMAIGRAMLIEGGGIYDSERRKDGLLSV